jgi:hypothetical protein
LPWQRVEPGVWIAETESGAQYRTVKDPFRPANEPSWELCYRDSLECGWTVLVSAAGSLWTLRSLADDHFRAQGR